MLVLSTLVASQQSPVPAEEEPHHHLVLKNDSVMVLRVKLLPGESTLFHTHSHDRVAVDLSDTTITRQKLGEPESGPETAKVGRVVALESNGPYTHQVHNAGASVFEALDVELLHRPTKASGPAAAKVEAENPSARVYKWTLAPGADVGDAYPRASLPDYCGYTAGAEDDGSRREVVHARSEAGGRSLGRCQGHALTGQ